MNCFLAVVQSGIVECGMASPCNMEGTIPEFSHNVDGRTPTIAPCIHCRTFFVFHV